MRVIAHDLQADDGVKEITRPLPVRHSDRKVIEGERAERARLARQRFGMDIKYFRPEVRDRLTDEHVREDDLTLRRADAQAMAAPQLRGNRVLQRLMEDVHRLERRRKF